MLDSIDNSRFETDGFLEDDGDLRGAVSLLQARLGSLHSLLYSTFGPRETTCIPAGDILQSIRLIDGRLKAHMHERGVYSSAVSFLHVGERYPIGDVGTWHIDGSKRAFVALGGIANLQAARGPVAKGDGTIDSFLYAPSPEQIVTLQQREVGLMDGETVHRRGPVLSHGWTIFAEAHYR